MTDSTDMPRPIPLTLIVAATHTLGIGKAGGLPWPSLKPDMAYFARVTKRVPAQLASTGNLAATSCKDMKNAVIMGRKTWDSIPPKFRPLKERLNVVVTRQGLVEGGEHPDVVVSKSLEDVVNQLSLQENVGRVYVIGGATIYEAVLKMKETRSVLLTKVGGEWVCDTQFPVDVESDAGWIKKSREELRAFVGEDVEEKVDADGTEIEFCLFERNVD